MPIAAVPAYLGNDFKEASPGMRFSMLLPIWTSREDQEAEVKKRAEAKSPEGKQISELLQRQGLEALIRSLRDEDWCRQQRLKPLPGRWDKNDFAARRAWKAIKTLTPSDQERMKHLALRQSALAATVPTDGLLRIEATAIAPFTTGLGNEHPLENGFAFLNPYGLPYLPGSGVKGVVRQAAQELASGQWGDSHGWSEQAHYRINVGTQKDPRWLDLSMLDVLFGRETPGGDSDHVRGSLSFWDVIPQIAGDSLMVAIMTPHQSHYYQQKKDKKSGDSVSPHDSGQPNPICFLTVPPGSSFTFHVVCDNEHLRRLTQNKLEGATDLLAADQSHWKRLLEAAFQHAFEWLGFGAKTAVGYGRLHVIEESEQRRGSSYDQELAEREQAAATAAEQPEKEARAKRLDQVLESHRRTIKTFKGAQDKSALEAMLKNYDAMGLSPEERRLVSNQLMDALPKELRKGKLADALRKWGSSSG